MLYRESVKTVVIDPIARRSGRQITDLPHEHPGLTLRRPIIVRHQIGMRDTIDIQKNQEISVRSLRGSIPGAGKGDVLPPGHNLADREWGSR